MRSGDKSIAKIQKKQKKRAKLKTKINYQMSPKAKRSEHTKNKQTECKRLVVKLKRVEKESFKFNSDERTDKINKSEKLEALQDQCRNRNNLYEGSALSHNTQKTKRNVLVNFKDIEKQTDLQLKDCKQLRVRVKRIDKIKPKTGSSEKKVDSNQIVQPNNTIKTMKTRRVLAKVTTNYNNESNILLRVNKKRNQTNLSPTDSLKQNMQQNKNKIEVRKLTRQAVKKDAAIKITNYNKESNTLPKVKKKPEKTNASSTKQSKENVILSNLVMTPLRRHNLNKLSLTKCSTTKKATSICSPKTLDVSRFSPIRNSTVLGLGKQMVFERSREDDAENMGNKSAESSAKSNSANSKGSRVLKNLTNNPELIEQIISTEKDSEDEIEIINTKENENTTKNDATKHENKSHKFFHRSPMKKTTSTTISKEPAQIFEFLSQSDTSECERAKSKDPAADIIQKMISQGKVRVASTHKGTGRPFIRRVRQKNGKKKKEINKTKATKLKVKEITKKGRNTNASTNELSNNCNDGVSVMPVPKIIEHPSFDAQGMVEMDEHINEGGFSSLARSVLLQQTKKYENKHNKDPTEQRRLLEMARKFVSTPAVNHQNGELSTTNLSPIQSLDVQRRPVCPSPWRIDDNSHLPRVFNFSKNTSCMPTFSSDYFPPTPKKNTSNNNTHIFNESNVTTHEPTSLEQENSLPLSTNLTNNNSSGHLTKSLGSEQNSNAENMPPPTISNSDENANIFNLRQQPNPRRTLRNRSPLKAINIIEVVSLPPWNKPEARNDTQKDLTNSLVSGDNSKDEKSHKADDLFGFEEYLDPNSEDEKEESTKATNTKVPNKQSLKRNLHKKLKDLQKWRPKDTIQSKSDVATKSCRLFGEDDRPKQRLINEMLCSTMINCKHPQVDGSDEECSDKEEGNAKANETDFFNDYEPETTLDKKQIQRTYGRPVKRKRKRRNNFVMFLDSEESNSDSEGEEREQKKKVQKKRRNETPADAKENPELESFVNEFNSMCKEVESYELQVE